MAEKHCYFGVEILNLTAAQRDALVSLLRAIIPARLDGQPAYRNHARVRLDGNAAIFEALWDDGDLSTIAFRNRLGTAFGVDPATITVTTGSTTYGPLVTLSRGGLDRLRMILFGGAAATWEQSRQAALVYLRDNLAAWENA